MAARMFRKLALLHKIETAYGTNATPAAANAIIGTNVSFTPLDGEEISRDLMLPYMGHQGVLLDGLTAKLEFDVELAGAGAAGTVPKYGSLLRICGMAETVTAATSVVYSIIEDGVESGSLYFISDKVQHVMLGCRATVALSAAPLALPKLRFTVIGLLGTVTDIATMPAVSMTGWTTPVSVNKTNSALTLHGWAAIAESLSIELGNVLTPRFLIGSEAVLISDRKSTGTAIVEASQLSDINWFSKALSRARGAMMFKHGIAAGNIVQIDAPAVEIGKPSQGEKNGIVNYTLPMMFAPVTGRDELTITVK